MTKLFLKNKQFGFTLVETFVAIVILTIAVIGPLSLLSKAITDGNFAKNQITAYYLAQEGVELVVNRRDRNIDIPGGHWLDGLDSCIGKECIIDFTMDQDSITECSLGLSDNPNECARLFQHGSSKIYKYDSSQANETIFYRTIFIDEFGTGNNISGARVTAKVAWFYNGKLTEPFSLTSFIANH